MKKIIYHLSSFGLMFIFFISFQFSGFFALNCFAQGVAVNSDSSAANSSAMLDVKSTLKGMLIPRMTTAQRNAIASPATGLMVYDTDFDQFWYFDGIIWKECIGPQGPAGADGSNGATGPTGVAGTNGSDGATGPTGVAGTDGSDGATGPTGVAGTNGSDGATGPTGLTGIAGTNGSDGATGPAGPTGVAGADGSDGATGPAGPVGCGSANYVIKSNGASAVCSQIYDNGTNVGIGTTTPSGKLHVYQPSGSITNAHLGYVGAMTGSGAGGGAAYFISSQAGRVAMVGVTTGSSDYCATTGHSDVWTGHWGRTTYNSGVGVLGRCDDGGLGVYGYASDDAGFADYGVYGTCEDVASDWAGYFVGDIHATNYFDIAEMYPDDGEIPKAALVSLSQPSDDPKYTRVKISEKAYDSALIGVKSENPVIYLGPTEHADEYRQDHKELMKLMASAKRPDDSNPIWQRRKEILDKFNPKSSDDVGSAIALTGRIRVLVTTENGPIQPGDPITSSNKAGYGMKATKAGPIIGFAMSNMESGDGKIVVNISRTFYTPPGTREETKPKQVFDGGSVEMKEKDIWVDFSEDFINILKGNVPLITITSNNPAVTLSIAKKSVKGFKVVASEDVSKLKFDWIAMYKF